jgi:hypothetical protein
MVCGVWLTSLDSSLLDSNHDYWNMNRLRQFLYKSKVHLFLKPVMSIIVNHYSFFITSTKSESGRYSSTQDPSASTGVSPHTQT